MQAKGVCRDVSGMYGVGLREISHGAGTPGWKSIADCKSKHIPDESATSHVPIHKLCQRSLFTSGPQVVELVPLNAHVTSCFDAASPALQVKAVVRLAGDPK